MFSTREQAYENIINLSVTDSYIRQVLNDVKAGETIRASCKDIFWMDPDGSKSLLSNSRKALIAVEEVEVNLIAKEVYKAISGGDDSGQDIWIEKVLVYLRSVFQLRINISVYDCVFLVTNLFHFSSPDMSCTLVDVICGLTLGILSLAIGVTSMQFSWICRAV